MGAYHLQPVYRDGKAMEISVKDIKPGDYIPFNSSISLNIYFDFFNFPFPCSNILTA